MFGNFLRTRQYSIAGRGCSFPASARPTVPVAGRELESIPLLVIARSVSSSFHGANRKPDLIRFQILYPILQNPRFGMNGRSGYSNGYSDAGQYDRNDGGYDNGSSLGADGYSGGKGRERRPRGYGGFQLEEAQLPPSSASQSPGRRRERGYRDRPQQSKSRSRTRDVEPGTRWKHSRDEPPMEEYMASRTRELNRSDGIDGERDVNATGPQAVEGSHLPYPAPSPIEVLCIVQIDGLRQTADGLTSVCRCPAIDSRRLGFHGVRGLHTGTSGFTIDGYEYPGQGRA